jgi:hypothetical protein
MAISIGPRISDATGGSISTITGYKVHTFTTDGSFTSTQTGRVEVLIVGGGGGGAPSGISGGSGGGAGSIVYKKYQSVTAATSYPITVGSGGPSPVSNVTTYTSSGQYTPPEDGTVEVLIVGGGGGAGTVPSPDYGGAGAGSVLYKKFQPVTGGTGYPIVIGAAGNPNVGPSTPGAAGGDTIAFTVTAPGGAGPSEPSDDPLGSVPANSASNPVGSGGGGRRSQEGGLGANVIGYGFAGGDGGGGGGGAGSAGNPSGTPWPGHVGTGVTYSISGSPVYYGRGGGSIDSGLMPIPEAVLYDSGYGFGGDADEYPSSYDAYGGSGPSKRFARGRPGIVIIRDNSGSSGSASTAFGVTAPGGAGSGKSNPAGSGGGLSFRDTSSDSPITLPGTPTGGTGANVDKEGYSGGEANPSTGAGGGGGGVSSAGQPSPGGGLGGSGYISPISGIATTYSHGGPASGVTDPTYIPGNYGNGGAGGASGTNGVVIIRYVS